MSRKFCPRKFSRFCWQILAIILVLFALVVSLFRGLLPQLDEVRTELVRYVEQQYQIQVNVGQLAAEWQAFGPALTVKKLVIPPQEHLPFSSVVNAVHIKFDFWDSLLTRTPQIENVIFDGVQVALDIDKLNTSSGAASVQKADTDWVYQLLLEQLERFSIKQASLQLLSKNHDYRPIFVKDLKWYNSTNLHRGEGKLYLDEEASEVELLSLQLDIKGSGNRPDELKGQVYLAAQSLDLGEWASRQQNPYDEKEKLALEGVINLQAWMNLSHRSIDSGLIEFSPSWLEWSLSDQLQRFEVKAGQLEWLPTLEGWRLSSRDLAFESNQTPWSELLFIVEKREQAVFSYLNTLNTSSLLPLLPLVPGVELSTLNTWQKLNPTGDINAIKLTKFVDQAPQLSLAVQQLSWTGDASIPGSAPIDLDLGWADESVYISVPEQDYLLDFSGGFKAPLSLVGKAFDAKFYLPEQALIIPKLQLSNPDISVDASVRLDLGERTHLALLSDLKITDVAQVGKYLPLKGMSPGLVAYLEKGLVAGNLPDGKLVWHGDLAGYPYQDHSGVFQASFTIEQAEFEFQPDWPSVTELNLSALFENERMDLTINRGDLMDVVVDGAKIAIPQLGARSLLEVTAALQTQGWAATQVIQASPLADSVGSTLSVVQINGEVAASLDLKIPLYNARPGEVVKEDIKGVVKFDSTPVYITEPGVQLGAVSGEVSFVNEVVKGQDISATLFQQPISFDFETGNVGRNYGLNLDMKGAWQLAELSDELANPLQDFYSGELDWDGSLTLVFDPTGYRIQAQVSTDLLGVDLALPAPFTKSKNEARKLSAELIGDNKQSSLGIKLGKQMEFWGGFDQESGNQLAHYDLLLGRLFKPGDQLKKEQGHLQLDIAKTDLTPWLPIINRFTASPSVSLVNKQTSASIDTQVVVDEAISAESVVAEELASEALAVEIVNDSTHKAFFPPLVSIDADIAHFNLMGQALTDLEMTARPTAESWRFEAKSNELDGRVDFYPDWATQGLKLVASKFHLAPTIKDQSNADFQTVTVLDNLPPLAIDVDEFSFYGSPLGHLVLQGSPVNNSYQIQTVSLTTPEVKLRGKGVWKNENNENITQFDVKLTATKFDALSAIVDMDPGLKDAPVEVSAEVSWLGAPYQFSVESLNGLVSFDLGKGHLSEVSDKGARIFSLFSLDSLLRKLSLDFSDVFGKGLYFNSFTGTLNIDDGVVKTRDTEMDAVAGNMKVRGYTDLMTESLNYDIRFVPQLASSVPTVVLLTTGGWTLGLGAFALTKVLEPVIEVISEIRFQLTGTMAEPKLEELGRKSKEIEIPESILPRKPEAEKIPDSDEPAVQQPNSGVEIPATNVIEMPNFKESERIEKDVQDANQPTTVPKQSRHIEESGVYRVAA
ncbi:TIGR02099 family protein [Shewanella eurypsychrophilus]|uniref:TIGR02099 family protein n=1 Tax=Shewanella eurypsychrophilus TaxID=2593656 RepID=A0ABX8S6K2_9GAMM|nr:MULTISPECIES: YhdP family protein [Shewanella]QFU24634.1 TIGR02099 family protein [Shewanella sp. YLB-09]QXP44929.1 TIGR02099 family protein [Shewanella eurypsychrophilus]